MGSVIETLWLLCKSNEMKLCDLQIVIAQQDISNLGALISDHIRCNDSIFGKLSNIAKSIMNVPDNKKLLTSQIIAESHHLSTAIAAELDTIYKIISPSKQTSQRLTKTWSISNKQNALLRNLQFLNKLISNSAFCKFDATKICLKDGEDFEELQKLHSEQVLLLSQCSRGMEALWVSLARCLEVFGYVPKEILL